MFAYEIEKTIQTTLAALEVSKEKREQIDVLLNKEPREQIGVVNRQTGRIYNERTVVAKLTTDLAAQDREIQRLKMQLNRLSADLSEAQLRESKARVLADEVTARMATVDALLANSAVSLAAELRQLIADGDTVIAEMESINELLPPDERLTPAHMLARLIDQPERIVSERVVDLWIDEKNRQPVSAKMLHCFQGIEKARAQRICGLHGGGRAFLIPVREITFIPAHRFDWLSEHGEPAPQTRLEGIPDDFMTARDEAVAADERIIAA